MNLKGKKVALIQGGDSPEREISYKSSAVVESVLKNLPCSYVKVEADSSLPAQLQIEKPDIAFIGLHGAYGEDGCVQALCELLKIPYTGSGVLSSALCMHKIFFKEMLVKNKIPTPEFQVLTTPQTPLLPYPLVLKASHGGSSLGTFILKDDSELKTYFPKAKQLGQAVFVEKKISSCQEIAVSIFNEKILTPIEIKPKRGFYDYKSKYEKGQTTFLIPPEIDKMIIEKIKHLSEQVFRMSNVRGYGRLDFLLDKNQVPWVVELNTLPGLTKTSLLPQSTQYDGISFTELIKGILESATTDYDFKKYE